LKRKIRPITSSSQTEPHIDQAPQRFTAPKYPSVSSKEKRQISTSLLTPGLSTRPQGQTPPASPFLNHNLSKNASVTRGLRRQQIIPACARTDPCSTGGTVIPDRPFGGPPQRWRASKARRSPCQPRPGTAEATRSRSRPQKTNRRSPGYSAGQSRCLSEDASAPGPLSRPAPMNRGIRTRLIRVNCLFADCRSHPSRAEPAPFFPGRLAVEWRAPQSRHAAS